MSSSLNEHVHFHVCVVDGVFEEVAGDVIADVQPTPPSVIFHPASEIDETVVALVPPPRTHRHRYFGVLAPNSPLRAAAVAMAAPSQATPAQPAQTGTGVGVPGVVPQGNAVPSTLEPAAPPKQSKAHYLWAVLIARIYEVFPLLWEDGDGQVDDGVQIEADWDMAAQPAPDYCVDQRVNW